MAALLRSGALLAVFLPAAIGQPALHDHPAIQYARAPLTDPVSQLHRAIVEGRAHLDFEYPHGYLRSLLATLHVPVESQILVFSKTSLQSLRIEPDNPRMVFFNDSVVVSMVNSGFVEIASLDPRQGMIFYRAAQRPAPASESPLTRRLDCLNCHSVPATLDVPGGLIKSVYPARDGIPLPQFEAPATDDRTPFEKRWGGWYVTGTSGSARHMGNAVVTDPLHPESMITSATVNLESLDGKLDTKPLLSPYSDIVALMVFEHQLHMMNLLTRAGWEVRTAGTQLQSIVQDLVDYLLFVDEALLPQPVEGHSGFAAHFQTAGPKDHRGRSFRELDLHTRLMRYPCSYTIYSETFDAMPEAAKQAVYTRMWQILSGKESTAKYRRLSFESRKAIVEILRDTKPDLPPYFQNVRR